MTDSKGFSELRHFVGRKYDFPDFDLYYFDEYRRAIPVENENGYQTMLKK